MGRVIVLGLCMITRDIDVTSLEFGSFDVDTDLGLGVFVSEEQGQNIPAPRIPT